MTDPAVVNITRHPFVCPRCGSKPNEHGSVPQYARTEHPRRSESWCEGVLCQCPHDTSEMHGETFEDPCLEAFCGCCGWGGRLPRLPPKMQAWQKKALEAGWQPPIGWRCSDKVET